MFAVSIYKLKKNLILLNFSLFGVIFINFACKILHFDMYLSYKGSIQGFQTWIQLCEKKLASMYNFTRPFHP